MFRCVVAKAKRAGDRLDLFPDYSKTILPAPDNRLKDMKEIRPFGLIHRDKLQSCFPEGVIYSCSHWC